MVIKIMSKFISFFKQPPVWVSLSILGLVFVSAVSGGIAGGWMAKRVVPNDQYGFKVPSSTSVAPTQVAVTSTSIKLVSVKMQDPSERLIPESVLNRQSPVGLIYARKKGFAAESVLSDQELQGRVVAVTSDGWFVTTPRAIEGWRIAEMLVWYNGRAYKIDRALLDKATQAVFIKTSARDLPATPFANLWSTKTGLAVWMESSPNEYSPSSIEALRSQIATEPVSSERAVRRLVALGSLRKGEWASPVWDPKGALVGIVESSAEGRLLVIPGSNLAASLQSLIGGGQITHAVLGVNSLDRTLIRTTAVDATMPTRGAWVKESKTLTRSAALEIFPDALKINDVILQVDRDILDGSSDLSDIILQYRPGSQVTLRVWRDGKELEIPVTLGNQPTSELIP